jgi:hypothetical protein
VPLVNRLPRLALILLSVLMVAAGRSRATAAAPASTTAGTARYRYTLIEEVSQPETCIELSLNDAGSVAYLVDLANGSMEIRRGSGGPITHLGENLTDRIAPIINNQGQIAFVGIGPTLPSGTSTQVIYLSDGSGSPSQLVCDVLRTEQPGQAGTGMHLKLLDFDEAGRIFALTETQQGSNPFENVLRFQGTSLTFLQSHPRSDGTRFERMGVDEGGHVFIGVNRLGFPDRVGIRRDTVEVVPGDGALQSFSLQPIVVNATGDLCFLARTADGKTVLFLKRAADVGLTPLIQEGDTFRILGAFQLSINDAAQFLFGGLLPDGRAGLFTGPDPVTDAVIAVGDPLLGSTVIGLPQGLSSHLLNNKGQVAFIADLADFRSVVVRADPIGTGASVTGKVQFEKVPVTNRGLQPAGARPTPADDVLVEAVEQGTDAVLHQTQTRVDGSFSLSVPEGAAIRLRATSQDVLNSRIVRDGPDGKELYSVVGKSFKVKTSNKPQNLLARYDKGKGIAGAFNILAVIHRANRFVLGVEPGLSLGPAEVTWPSSEVSGFDLEHSQLTPVVLGRFGLHGDPKLDTDEFDDSVIAHEYGHFMEFQFSRTFTHGGPHGFTQALDPVVAWSEGWADFFSCAVLESPVYLDSHAKSKLNRKSVTSFNLETNPAANTNPGYWMELTVGTALWDLLDGPADAGDSVTLPMAAIWSAFRLLKEESFTYLIDFADVLVNGHPEAAVPLQDILQARNIDYTPGLDPSVPDPFPTPIVPGAVLNDEVDSLTLKQGNQLQSSRYYEFRLTQPAHLKAALDILPIANQDPDLNLILLNRDGSLVVEADQIGDTDELIERDLAPGTYVLRVGSSPFPKGLVFFAHAKFQLTVDL